MSKNRFGLSVALATPFTEQRMIDLPRLVAHGGQSLADGCTSLTVFGAMGEGASGGISGLANIALGLMQPLLEGREEPKVDAMVEAVLPYAVTAAVKALVGLRPEEQDERSREGTP